jgi:GNAT superfamily N-acetyltransferase
VKRTEGLVFEPATAARWGDLERLFRDGHPFPGCWCMYWRIKRRDFEKNCGERNRLAFRRIVESGEVPGILAYAGGEPVGWCSVAPREMFPVLDRSPVLKRVDDEPVWSITCFFIPQRYRKRGLSEALVGAAIDYVGENGGSIVEAYPLIPEKSKNPEISAYMGLFSTYLKMGFKEVSRRSPMRPVVRYYLDEKHPTKAKTHGPSAQRDDAADFPGRRAHRRRRPGGRPVHDQHADPRRGKDTGAD